MKQIKYFYKGLIAVLKKYLTVQQIHEYLLPYAELDSKLISDTIEPEILFEIVFNQRPVDKDSILIIDTLISYINKIFTKDKSGKLLLELGAFMLTQGELNIVFETATFVINSTGDDMANEDLKASSFVLLAEHYIKQSMWNKAFEFIDKAKNIYKNDKIGNAKCEYLSGLIKLEKGDIVGSKLDFQRILTYADIQNECLLTAMIEMKLGIISCIQEDYEEALCFYNKAFKKFDQSDNINGKAEVILYKGIVYKKLKDYQSAINQIDNCLELAKKYDLVYLVSSGYLNKAEIFMRQKDLELASIFLNKSMQLSYQLNSRSSIAKAYKIRGLIAGCKRSYLVAENYLTTGLRLNRELGLELESAAVMLELGLLYRETGEVKKASANINDGLTYLKSQDIKKISREIESHIFKLEMQK
jgi:tetratricopeptide (TPR) repeat protein